MTVIGFILLLWILGIVVEKTKFMSKGRGGAGYNQLLPEGEQPRPQTDKDLVNSKTKCGLALLSFSPLRNFRKLVERGSEADKDMKVLNGIRFLSMCWVVLGHTYAFALFWHAPDNITGV